MSKVAIYHMSRTAARDSLFNVGRTDSLTASAKVVEAVRAGQYVYNARLKIDESQHGDETVDQYLLDRMWRLTNSVDELWTENKEVIYDASGGKGQRSSMPGDVFWVNGNAFMVASAGFTLLTYEAAKAIVTAPPGVS